jgi:hypothetical protein
MEVNLQVHLQQQGIFFASLINVKKTMEAK